MLRLNLPLLVILFVIVLLLFSRRLTGRVGVRPADDPASRSSRGGSAAGRAFFVGLGLLLAALVVVQFWLRSMD